MGGHGLYASIGEYMKFIRMWLNDGAGPHGRVLKAETVEAAVSGGRLSGRHGMPRSYTDCSCISSSTSIRRALEKASLPSGQVTTGG
jgi:CubicO group peptidase (beta-lactamase class C family)